MFPGKKKQKNMWVTWTEDKQRNRVSFSLPIYYFASITIIYSVENCELLPRLNKTFPVYLQWAWVKSSVDMKYRRNLQERKKVFLTWFTWWGATLFWRHAEGGMPWESAEASRPVPLTLDACNRRVRLRATNQHAHKVTSHPSVSVRRYGIRKRGIVSTRTSTKLKSCALFFKIMREYKTSKS